MSTQPRCIPEVASDDFLLASYRCLPIPSSLDIGSHAPRALSTLQSFRYPRTSIWLCAEVSEICYFCCNAGKLARGEGNVVTTKQPRIVGLTGGIATGKTTVSDYLASRYQFPVFDADILAREAVATGTPTLNAIAARYGPDILLADGSLDRKALGAIIFQDAAERHWLEAQIHPEVRTRLLAAIAHCQSNTIVLAVPLLFEARMEDLATEIWVVTCPPEVQLARLMARDGLTEAQARDRIAAQMPLTEKIARADCILENSGPIADLLHWVDVRARSR